MKKVLKKKIFAGIMVSLFALGAAGCGQNSEKETKASQNTDQTGGETIENNDSTHIVIGGTAISEVTYEAIKPHFEEKGYTTEFIMFDANPVVIEACNSGEVDMALGQHKKFIESYNENNGGNLSMAKPYGYFTGIGLYSEKYSDVESFPDGARIAIMNDAMNMDIALRILEDCGFIKIDEEIDVATIADITENPKNLSILDMDQAQTVTALKDMDAACIFFTHMSNAGLDPKTYLARDSQMIKYPMGVIVKVEDKDSKWAVDFAECFKIQAVRDEIDSVYPGVFEYYEDDSQAE